MNTSAPISACRTTKIYCRPDCPAGRRTKPENKRYFNSRTEARANGYRACKICKSDGPNPKKEVLLLSYHHGPLGTYVIADSPQGVVFMKPEEQAQRFVTRWKREGIELRDNKASEHGLSIQLNRYFTGQLRLFDIRLDLRGTPFQRLVWSHLYSIPWGETQSYRQVAEALGRPKAARAVGRAVGTNPVSIVVPCHRIIGSDGKLTGYGGGLDRKAALLALEGSI